MAEILPEAPLIAFFCKSDAAFQEEAEHGPRPVLLAVTRSCPGQANWEHAGILCPTKKCHRPLWRWHFLDYLDMSQPAWLSWRTFLVCSTNVGCCFWAPWGQNLPANCACSLFLRAVASCRDTSSFFFFSHTFSSWCFLYARTVKKHFHFDAFLWVARLHFEGQTLEPGVGKKVVSYFWWAIFPIFVLSIIIKSSYQWWLKSDFPFDC